jgi:hypothetical protein
LIDVGDSERTEVMTRAASLALIASALVAVPGCSVLFVRGAPAHDPGTRPLPCTQSYLAPAIDGVPGGTLLVGGVAGIAWALSRPRGDSHEFSAEGVVFLTGILATLASLPLVASGSYGYVKVRGCRRMNESPPRPMPMPAAPSPAAPNPSAQPGG